MYLQNITRVLGFTPTAVNFSWALKSRINLPECVKGYAKESGPHLWEMAEQKFKKKVNQVESYSSSICTLREKTVLYAVFNLYVLIK